MSYGPQLPGWLSNEKEIDEKEEDSESNVYGPVIPSRVTSATDDKETIGPAIPAQFLKNQECEEEDDDEEAVGVYGPAIPKTVSEEVSNNVEDDEDEDDIDANSYGPSVPANFRPNVSSTFPADVESDDEIGPMPVSKGNEEREALERAYRLHMQKEAEEEEKNSAPKREEWMTSVPKKLGNFGLGARTFKKGTASERDSTWEDAPGAKKKRKEETKSGKSAAIAAADARQAAMVAEKTAGPSLMELHQKKREEKVKEAGYTPGERRPFDREKDMEVRGLKAGGSKEAVDRMKELTGRFANSKEQRFL